MKEKSLTPKEKRWILVFAAGVVLLTSLPYLIAFANQPEGFTGFLFGVEDGNSYIAKMLLGAQGDWLFRSPYSSANQLGALLYLPYLILGKLIGPDGSHLQLVLLFHLFRAASIVALCFACYEFFAFLLDRIALRRLALALAILGGGLGWVFVVFGKPEIFGSMPLDFYSPETFGFLAVFGLPHLVLGRAILLWGLLAYLRAPQRVEKPWLVVLLWFGLSIVHLIDAGLGLLLIGVHVIALLILQKKRTKDIAALKPQLNYVIWAAIGVAPVFVFNVLVFLRDAYLRSWAEQNQILSPNPLHYLIAFGWLLPFAYFGIQELRRRDPRLSWFFLSWLIILPVLLYLPFGLQRRLAEGSWLLLVGIALLAFEADWAQKKQQLWLFALAAPSTLILLLGSLVAASNSALPVSVPNNEVAAFDRLRQEAEPGEIVLAPYAVSNALPAWSPQRVLIGHGPESVGPKQLPTLVENFFNLRMPDEERIQFLQNNDVAYVFWTPNEQDLGKWDPETASFLKLLFDFGGYKVFKVLL